MLKIKHIWLDGNDLIVALANLRLKSAWCPWNNCLGPCYGIAVVQDVFSGPASRLDDLFKDGYIDYQDSNVTFIPTPKSFSNLLILDDFFVTSNKKGIHIYDRRTGEDVTPDSLANEPKHIGISTVLDRPIKGYCNDAFYLGKQFYKEHIVENNWVRPFHSQREKLRWTLDWFHIETGHPKNLVTRHCKTSTHRVDKNMVVPWEDSSLVYPALVHEASGFWVEMLDYADAINGVAKPKVTAKYLLGYKPSVGAAIDKMRVTATAIGFKVDDDKDGSQHLDVFDKKSGAVLSHLRLDETFAGFHKFRLTKESIYISTRTNLHSNRTESDMYQVFRIKLGCDGLPEELYKGEGVDFSTLYRREDFLLIQKNFDAFRVVIH